MPSLDLASWSTKGEERHRMPAECPVLTSCAPRCAGAHPHNQTPCEKQNQNPLLYLLKHPWRPIGQEEQETRLARCPRGPSDSRGLCSRNFYKSQSHRCQQSASNDECQTLEPQASTGLFRPLSDLSVAAREPPGAPAAMPRYAHTWSRLFPASSRVIQGNDT